MTWFRPGCVFVTVLVAGLLAPCLALQSGGPGDVFTISFSSPTQAQKAQVRYMIADDSSSTTTQLEGNKIVVRTSGSLESGRGLKAVVYTPGCQFLTFSASDLASGNRLSEFQCQKLPTVQFQGRLPGIDPRGLEVEVLYKLGWAERFFELSALSVSPFTVTTASVQPDGSFNVELPDFAADPLWSLANDATLTFRLVRSGQPMGVLSSPFDSKEGFKVATSYAPEISFTLQEGNSKDSQ